MITKQCPVERPYCSTDSQTKLLTPTDVDLFGKGDLKGDMGLESKALTAPKKLCKQFEVQCRYGMY